MRNRLLLLLLLCATGAAAQIPSITTNSLVRFKEGNTVFDRTVGDIFSTIDVDLTTGVTGTLPVANGGTGATTFTANRVLLGNGTSAINSSANFTFSGNTISVSGVGSGQQNVATFLNTNAGSNDQQVLRFWNDGGSTGADGAYIGLASSARTAPYGHAFFIWNAENGPLAFAMNNAEKMRVTANGLIIGSTASAANKLDVEGGAVIGATYSGSNTAPTNGLLVQGNVGIGTTSVSNALDVAGVAQVSSSANNTLIITSTNTTGTSFRLNNTSASGGQFEFAVTGSANGFGAGSFTLYDNVAAATRMRIDASGNIGASSAATLSAKLHVTGPGTTSGTKTALFENSSGTDILTIRDDGASAFGGLPATSVRLTAAATTADSTTFALDAKRSSESSVLKVRADGKVAVNNAAFQDALTVNGKARADGLVLTNQTATNTSSGQVQYNNGGGSHSGYVTVGDGTRQLAFMPTMIERDIVDYNVDWTTGRKGAFWTVPARFDGWKIAKVYIGITNIGSGAGDDELTIEIGGVGEGVQVVTAGTHTLVMDDVINTDDVITFNITAISATPAKGLNVALELSKN